MNHPQEYEIHSSFVESYRSWSYTYENTQEYDPEINYKVLGKNLKLHIEALINAAEVKEDNYTIDRCTSISLGLNEDLANSGLQ